MTTNPAEPEGGGTIRLVPLPPPVLKALADGDLRAAAALMHRDLPGYFADEELRFVWRLHLHRLDADPEATPWSVHVAVAGDVAVGHGGFHARPDGTGMVEVGYSVDPAHRRRGHAKAILRELFRRAAAAPEVTRVRAVVDRDNMASLATLGGFGFARVGERGREIIFEAPAGGSRRP